MHSFSFETSRKIFEEMKCSKYNNVNIQTISLCSSYNINSFVNCNNLYVKCLNTYIIRFL